MAPVQDVLAGRYELLDVLGRGGMGVVYRATDRLLDRTVAVKVLPVDRAADPTFVTRFEREALAAAALSHPNIIWVFDSGQARQRPDSISSAQDERGPRRLRLPRDAAQEERRRRDRQAKKDQPTHEGAVG